MKEIEQFFESLKPAWHICITCCAGIIPYIAPVTSLIALFVLLFQLRVVYYNGKLKKIEYDKACKGE